MPKRSPASNIRSMSSGSIEWNNKVRGFSKFAEFKNAIDAAWPVIGGNVSVETERVKQLFRFVLKPGHRESPRAQRSNDGITRSSGIQAEFFNGILVFSQM
jgi:hypothetical protein